MPFWTYMLHCADRSFYVGHTDDLEKRVAQHEGGLIPGYTSERLPVKLVWSQDFATPDQARVAEARVKGWSRAKKLALIREDWASISALAKSRERASTGSAKPGFFAERFLHPHLGRLPSEPLSLEVVMRANAERFAIRFRLTGSLNHLAIPPPAKSARRDELWQRTCFEAFVELDGGPAYLEFNLSPSTEWAAYHFTDYRTGMNPLDIDPPRLRCTRTRFALELAAAIVVPASSRPTRLGLSAVIEEADGTKSYWALAHPSGAPDFHHPDCFVLELPSPAAP